MMNDSCEVLVRRSTREDIESFHRCLDAVARERRWLAFLQAPPLESVRDFVLSASPIQFVAMARGEVAGWCDVTPNQLEGFRHCGTLGMGLLPDFRGRGLGRRLLQETIDATREAGLTRIELEVFASNQIATRLYERFGFTHEGRKHGARLLDGQLEDNLCMALLALSLGGAPQAKPPS